MHAPFCAVIDSQTAYSNLVSALNSMSQEMLRYKNLHYAKQLVLDAEGCADLFKRS
jgi:hypothetical protein